MTPLVAAALATACGSDPAPSPPPTAPIVVTTPSVLPDATVDVPYDVTLRATGGNGTYVWHAMTIPLPDGLTLSEEGRLSGTPRNAFTSGISVRVTSGSQVRIAGFILTIARPPLEIIPSALSDGVQGEGYSHFLDVAGGSGPTTWSVVSGALPPGVSLSTVGLLSGTPTSVGTFAVRIRAVRGALTAERDFTLRVHPAPLVITTSALSPAKVGEPYTVQLESRGGVGGNRWALRAGALPTGMQLTTGGTLDGTASVAGDFPFTAELSSGTQQVTRSLTLTVAPAGFPSTVTVTMPGNVFVPFLVQLARGGTVTWVFGAVPHNVIFAAAAGAPADINIVSNVSVARTFPTLGTFRYDCTIHPGMSGVVEVKP